MEEKTPKLRSELPIGVAWGDRRALMRGLGFSDEDLRKPHVGIINTYSSMNPGHVHLNRLAQAVTEGVRETGGLPLQFNAVNLCDGIVAPRSEYTLPSRDLLVNEVEVIVEANLLDAVVLLGTCDKIIPGLLMAAARLDLPAIVVTGGYMGQGYANGKPVNYIDIGASVSAMLEGRCSRTEMMAVIDGACPAPGACDMMGTANTMALVCEAMGMSLPGNGSIAAASLPLDELARQAGRQVMTLWRKGITARGIITEQAVNNAVKVCMAVGGSTNALIHIPAIAGEAELEMDVAGAFDEASFRIPLLVRIRPNGPHSICQLEQAGGLRAILNELREDLDLDCLTVNGHTVAENIAGHTIRDSSIIRARGNGYQNEGGIAILRGNICPQGAAVKQSAVPPGLTAFRGPARIFYGEREACDALTDGRIQPGDAVVILYLGAKAGPGLASTANFTFQLAGSALANSICMVTDGRFSGASRGAVIGYISPEAAMGGPIAALRDGDIITYDIPSRILRAELTGEEIQKRLKENRRELRYRKGYLGIYQRCVTSLLQGAVVRGEPVSENHLEKGEGGETGDHIDSDAGGLYGLHLPDEALPGD